MNVKIRIKGSELVILGNLIQFHQMGIPFIQHVTDYCYRPRNSRRIVKLWSSASNKPHTGCHIIVRDRDIELVKLAATTVIDVMIK